MRPTWILALLVGMAALSGCTSDDDGDHCEDGHMDEHCPSTTTPPPTTGGPPTTTTPPTPNQPPVLGLSVTDDGGNETRTVMQGGNLTFDAKSSTDPDGTILDIAILVEDANGTRPARPLLRDGKFTPQTFNFPQPGVANVSIGLIDDAGGSARESIGIYVNHPQDLGEHSFNGAQPGLSASACAGTVEGSGGGSNPVDPLYYKEFNFETREGAQWVEVTAVLGHRADASVAAAEIAICDPDGNPVSDVGTEMVQTTPGTNLTASLAYYVAVVSHAPGTSVHITTVVHYDPQAASAEPEA